MNNLEEIIHYLNQIANSNDKNFAAAAQYVLQVIQQIQSGQLSEDEIVDILNDVQRQIDIMQDMSQMKIKETLNTAINALISIAKMAA
jgi:hypothetical protein